MIKIKSEDYKKKKSKAFEYLEFNMDQKVKLSTTGAMAIEAQSNGSAAHRGADSTMHQKQSTKELQETVFVNQSESIDFVNLSEVQWLLDSVYTDHINTDNLNFYEQRVICYNQSEVIL